MSRGSAAALEDVSVLEARPRRCGGALLRLQRAKACDEVWPNQGQRFLSSVVLELVKGLAASSGRRVFRISCSCGHYMHSSEEYAVFDQDGNGNSRRI